MVALGSLCLFFLDLSRGRALAEQDSHLRTGFQWELKQGLSFRKALARTLKWGAQTCVVQGLLGSPAAHQVQIGLPSLHQLFSDLCFGD